MSPVCILTPQSVWYSTKSALNQLYQWFQTISSLQVKELAILGMRLNIPIPLTTIRRSEFSNTTWRLGLPWRKLWSEIPKLGNCNPPNAYLSALESFRSLLEYYIKTATKAIAIFEPAFSIFTTLTIFLTMPDTCKKSLKMSRHYCTQRSR